MITVIPNIREVTRASAIPQGQTFRGRIGNYHERVFLKAYKYVIALDDPTGGAVWDNDIEIHDYQPINIELRIVS